MNAGAVPGGSMYPGAGVMQSSFDAFFGSTGGATQPGAASSASPVNSTLPHFDAFGATMAPAAQPYKTPFDSPDPPAGAAPPAQQQQLQQPEPQQQDDVFGLEDLGPPLTVEHMPADSIPSRTQRAKSYAGTSARGAFGGSGPSTAGTGTHFAFDASSIFHSSASSKTPTGTAASARASKKKHSGEKPHAQSTRAASSSSSSATKRGGAPAALDTSSEVFEGVIPDDIFSATAQLQRRGSEPVELLGSRRAAEAARAAAAAKGQQQHAAAAASPATRASTTPSSAATAVAAASAPSSAKGKPAGVARRLSIKTETLKTEQASDINLDPMVGSLASPITPRPSCVTCGEPSFAADLCAVHLTQKAAGGSMSPTGVIRRIHSLWSRKCLLSDGSSAARINLMWSFWKKAERYDIKLCEDPSSGERAVYVNGKLQYRSRPEAGFWKLSMLLGKSKSSAFEVLLEATPRSAIKGTGSVHLYPGLYEFELWLEGFPFAEAQNNFMSELGVAQQVAMQRADDAADEDNPAAGLSAAHQSAKAAHYDALHYISTHWSRRVEAAKTRLGYPKHVVTWCFTLHGRPHTLVLSHSSKSGKRTLVLDGRLLFSHTPNWINGLLLHKSSSQKMDIEGVPLEVRIQKLEWSGNAGGGQERPQFAYDLLIDGCPFAKCTKTLPEYAGGIVDVEKRVEEQKAAAARRARREAELKRDPRTVLSPE